MTTTTSRSTGWFNGRVKAVPSGDCLVIVGNGKTLPLPERTITLSSITAPRLARRETVDEPFSWDSREYLRQLCIGKDIIFKVEYTVSDIGREFGSVFLGEENVAMLVVSAGWAKVKDKSRQKDGEVSRYYAALLAAEERANDKGYGLWTRELGASKASIRKLPPSTIGSSSNFDFKSFLNENKGKGMDAIVEQVRDGSTIRAYLLPDFQFVEIYVAGIKAPSPGRRAPSDTAAKRKPTFDKKNEATSTAVKTKPASDSRNGETSKKTDDLLTSAQRPATSPSAVEVSPEPFGLDAKHFTEQHALNRDVVIVLEGLDKFKNLIGSVYYLDGESEKDLAFELVQNGLAKCVAWSLSKMEEEAKRELRSAELQAKKSRLKIWINEPFSTNSNSNVKSNGNFTGKVVEIVSGDCIIVADDSIPYDSPLAGRRVNLSSIRCPRLGNPRTDEGPEAYAREAKELLRQRLIGKQVNVSMEYSRNVSIGGGPTAGNGPKKFRTLDFGSVFLTSSTNGHTDESSPASPSTANQQSVVNIAAVLIARGLGTVIKHRDNEARSNHYDALLAAESRAFAGKKGTHSSKEPPLMRINDLTTTETAKKAKDFLGSLQRNGKVTAVVEYILSGHRFKLLIPKQTSLIAFSLSGVRCPGRGERYSEEAIALMKLMIMQRDVEIKVENCDKNGTFLGSLWESKKNLALTLLEAGLAKLQANFRGDDIPDFHLLQQAEQSAKTQKLNIWENYVEGQEVANGSAVMSKKKETLKVIVTEVLDGGKFYIQTVQDKNEASIQLRLASLSIQDAPVIGSFDPKRGDIVLAQFSGDNSWNRAMIVNDRVPVESPKHKFEVFYIDYGNQEVITYDCLRPLDSSTLSIPGLAQLCTLAYVKVPSLDEDYGEEAAEYLSELTLDSSKEFKAVIEERDSSGGKVKGQGTGTILRVTLVDEETEYSVNAAMIKEGLARVEKRWRSERQDRKEALDALEEVQEDARYNRRKIWEHGDIQSDDEDKGRPVTKTAGRR